MKIDLDDLDDLERKARAATPGPWRLGDWHAVFGTREHPERMLVLERNLTHAGAEPYICNRADGRFEVLRLAGPIEHQSNADHIVANSPPVTLSLIARIRVLEADLEHERKLHALAERAMRSANEASKGFEALAQRHFDAKEPLEQVADAARAFVEAQDPLAGGDFAGDKFEDLKRALAAAPIDPAVAALTAAADAALKAVRP